MIDLIKPQREDTCDYMCYGGFETFCHSMGTTVGAIGAGVATAGIVTGSAGMALGGLALGACGAGMRAIGTRFG